MTTTPPTPAGAPAVPAAWNATARPFRRDATIPVLLREAARRDPGGPALAAATGPAFTHGELDEWSDRAAALLADLGVAPGERVALYSDRTPLAVAALVAVLKRGAVYVPLDPAWPRRRVVALLDDLGVAAVVSGEPQLRDVAELRWQVPSLRHVLCTAIAQEHTWERLLDREMVEDFFDFLSGEEDPLEAAGFNLRRSHRPYTPADVRHYRDHVAALVHEQAGHGAAVLEVGCGSGQITAAVAPTARRYLASDPSSVAVEKNRVIAAEAGCAIEGWVGYAHEVAAHVEGPFDLAVLASTTQFLPDLDYLLTTLDSLTTVVRPGGAIVLADLIDPDLERHAGLRVAPALLERLPDLLAGIAAVEVRRRPPGEFAGELETRYDAVLHVARDPGRGPGAAAVRVRTGFDVAAAPAAPPPGPDAGDLAYAIFTSGSTGAPKAVAVTHRSVVNLVDWLTRTHGVGPGDTVLFVTSFCFDLSVYDMFGVLASGGAVRIASEEEIAEPQTLVDVLEQEPITLWDSAPAALSMVVPFLGLGAPRGREELRLVLLSGDWVPLALPGEMQRAFPRARVVALGGATEATVWSNHFPVERVDPAWPSVPYGRPIQNARYHVLDERLAPCPVGVPGDLYIAGECVALGYAGAPGRTASRFLADPFAPEPGGRMYRTGDRARWRPDGQMEFLGRLDDQVKVRGYRIELGEVRSVMAQVPGVRDAAVVALDLATGGRDLVAFHVRAPGGPDAAALRTHLATRLPAYMIPSRIVELAALPTSDTGKVDRAALLGHLEAPGGLSGPGTARP